MSQEVITKLQNIVTLNGKEVVKDARRLEALLKDYLPSNPKEVFLLVSAVKVGVVDDLLNQSHSNLLVEITIPRLAQKLVDLIAISIEASAWTVNTWCLVLQLAKPEQLTHASLLKAVEGPLTGMKFVIIPSGSFMMGSEYRDGKPVHKVSLYAFQMMNTLVTQEMLKLTNDPSINKGVNLPVENISWKDCQKIIRRLNELDPGKAYRLPTEAEWEYACRAGTTTRFYWGEDQNDTEIGNYAWYEDNSENSTHPVGQKLPNAWGLYDMSGNVYEWCEDIFHDDYNGAPSDGSAWLTLTQRNWVRPSDDYRVIRGGSYDFHFHDTFGHTSASRMFQNSSVGDGCVGFRLCRNA